MVDEELFEDAPEFGIQVLDNSRRRAASSPKPARAGVAAMESATAVRRIFLRLLEIKPDLSATAKATNANSPP